MWKMVCPHAFARVCAHLVLVELNFKCHQAVEMNGSKRHHQMVPRECFKIMKSQTSTR